MAIGSKLLESKRGWGRRWSTTRGSLLAGAARLEPQALATLCRVYWNPVYAFLVAQGAAPELAREATQGFFEGLLRRNDLAKVDLAHGRRFRSWLRTAAKSHFLNVLKKERQFAVGGQRVACSLDALEQPLRGELEPKDQHSPERLFEQRAARSILRRAWAKLREEFEARGEAAYFEELRKSVLAEEGLSDEAMTLAFQKTKTDVRTARSRLISDKFPRAVREVLAEMGVPAHCIQDELRALHDAL